MGNSKRKVVTNTTMTQKQAAIVTRALLHLPNPGLIPDLPQKGMKVWSRDKKMIGQMTGGYRLCQMEGCTGRAVGVRWPDKKITFPCTKGLEVHADGVKIM